MKLYGATAPGEIKILAESIAETGQLSPLIVTADLEKIGYYTILGGHKRADALRALGRTEANCQIADVQDADERAVWLVEANRHHVPTTEQKIRIGEVFFELETKKARARKVAGAKSAKKGDKEVETLAQADATTNKARDSDDAGKARDLAAKKVGMSGVSLERGMKTLKAADKAEEDGKNETAATLRRILNEKGVDPAFSQARSLHLIAQTARKKTASGEAKAVIATKPEGDTPQPPAPVSNGPKTDEITTPAVFLLADADDAETARQSAKDGSQLTNLTSVTVDAVDVEKSPVTSIITACKKLVEALEKLDPAGLTISQKWNLTRAFDALSKWQAKHEVTLKPPGQP